MKEESDSQNSTISKQADMIKLRILGCEVILGGGGPKWYHVYFYKREAKEDLNIHTEVKVI